MRIFIEVSEIKDDKIIQSKKEITIEDWKSIKYPGILAAHTINEAITEVEQEVNNA
jgi:hypothetical protein